MKNERIVKGFDRLAPVYSSLSGIVFGKSLDRAQNYFLDSINAGDHILILGGGSGDLLKSLLKKHPQITVDYIDISPKMIQLAKKKTQNPSIVNFIAGTEQNIPDGTYSIVITNFYLDLFTDSTLEHVVQKIRTHIKPDARWLATDFIEEQKWHSSMLKLMYFFFRIVAGIEANRLPDWQSGLEKAGLHEINSKKFYRGFIKASVYSFAEKTKV